MAFNSRIAGRVKGVFYLFLGVILIWSTYEIRLSDTVPAVAALGTLAAAWFSKMSADAVRASVMEMRHQRQQSVRPWISVRPSSDFFSVSRGKDYVYDFSDGLSDEKLGLSPKFVVVNSGAGPATNLTLTVEFDQGGGEWFGDGEFFHVLGDDIKIDLIRGRFAKLGNSMYFMRNSEELSRVTLLVGEAWEIDLSPQMWANFYFKIIQKGFLDDINNVPNIKLLAKFKCESPYGGVHEGVYEFTFVPQLYSPSAQFRAAFSIRGRDLKKGFQ